MSVLDSIANSILKYQHEQSHDRYPYLVKEGQDWVIKQNMNGCRPVKVQASILMDKNPAPFAGISALPPSSNTATQGSSLSNTPKASFQQRARDAKERDDCPIAPPPFDMLDIPGGMECMGFKYAAYCARRWFNGSAHTAPRGNAIFDSAFVDANSCKLGWVLSFGNVRRRYEHLINDQLNSDVGENIYNNSARYQLLEKLKGHMTRYRNYYYGSLDTLAECGGNKQILHRDFQFQLANVSVSDSLGRPTVVMNDLAASLANFSLYAAVAKANISTKKYMLYSTEPWKQCTHAKAEVTHIYVYAKDSYSFNDDSDGNASQYLGHWNQYGVIVALNPLIAEAFSKLLGTVSKSLMYEGGNTPRQYLPMPPLHLEKLLDRGRRLHKTEVFYPVRNRDFQNWRALKKHGGDFVIYSNLERIELPKPIELDLGQVCEDYRR